MWGRTLLRRHFHEQLPVTLMLWLNTLTQGWSISVIYSLICCSFHFQQETKVWNSKFKQSFTLLIEVLVIFARWSWGYIIAMVTGPTVTHLQALRKAKLKMNEQMSQDYFKISEPQKNFLVLLSPDDHRDCCCRGFQVYCLHWGCFLQVMGAKFKFADHPWTLPSAVHQKKMNGRTNAQTKLTFAGEMSGCWKRSELWLKLIFALVPWMCCSPHADRQPVGCGGMVHHPVIVNRFKAPALWIFIHLLLMDKTRKPGWQV